MTDYFEIPVERIAEMKAELAQARQQIEELKRERDAQWKRAEGWSNLAANCSEALKAAEQQLEEARAEIERQKGRRMEVLLDENCVETIKRLTPSGGEEIYFGGIMGGVKLLWRGNPATQEELLAQAQKERDEQCWHKEIDENGICKACGTRAAIEIRGMSKSGDHQRNAMDLRPVSHQIASAQKDLIAQARREGMEEAAKIAEKERDSPRTAFDTRWDACEAIAAAIRLAAEEGK